MKKTFYDILGVKNDASQEVIKAAYKILAQKYHPDKNSHKESEAVMKDINSAYSTLSNTQDRKIYDIYLNQQQTIEKDKLEEQIRLDE
jgi:molecular chaperone DnaJ